MRHWHCLQLLQGNIRRGVQIKAWSSVLQKDLICNTGSSDVLQNWPVLFIPSGLAAYGLGDWQLCWSLVYAKWLLNYALSRSRTRDPIFE